MVSGQVQTGYWEAMKELVTGQLLLAMSGVTAYRLTFAEPIAVRRC